jgi:hypothetical protein
VDFDVITPMKSFHNLTNVSTPKPASMSFAAAVGAAKTKFQKLRRDSNGCQGSQILSRCARQNVARHKHSSRCRARDAWPQGDGRKALFLRNAGDEKFPNLKTERVFAEENPPTHEQGTDRPVVSFAPARSKMTLNGSPVISPLSPKLTSKQTS